MTGNESVLTFTLFFHQDDYTLLSSALTGIDKKFYFAKLKVNCDVLSF